MTDKIWLRNSDNLVWTDPPIVPFHFTEYTLTDLVDKLIDAIREEGGWGEDIMDAMVSISPDKFIEVTGDKP